MSELVGKRDRVSNYYSIKNGKVVKDFGKTEPPSMEGVTKRVNKNGETVYEMLSDYIAGRLVKAELQPPPEEHPDYKEQMMLTLEGDNNVKAIVRIPFDSAYGRGFLLSVPNIELDQPLELEPYKYADKKTGKDKMGLSVIQFGSQVDWAHGTKENPGDVPKLEKTTFKGKEVWDNTKQLEYFRSFFSKLADNIAETYEMDRLSSDDLDEEDDDLPI